MAPPELAQVMHDGVAEKIRLEGIDCPERKQPFGNKAKQFVLDLAAGQGATGQAVLLDPATPENWNDWQPLPNTLEPVDGVIRHTFTVPAGRFAPHSVVVFKLSKIVADEQGE